MSSEPLPSPDLLRGMAHLLRTPLTVILGMTATLRDYDHRFSAEQRAEYLGEVHQAADDIRVALDGLSLLARLLTRSLPITPTPLPLGDLLRAGAGALDSVWGHGAPLLLAAAPAGRVRADEQRITQAFEALARAVTPVAGVALMAEAVAAPAVRLGPVTPVLGEDLRAVLHAPLEELDAGALVARPGGWPALVARLLVEAQGGSLTLDVPAPARRSAPDDDEFAAFTLPVYEATVRLSLPSA